jgi:hypothetical protein
MEEVMREVSGIHYPPGSSRIPYALTSLCSEWQAFFLVVVSVPFNRYY